MYGTKQQLIEGLASLTPMPDDEEVTQEQLNEYAELCWSIARTMNKDPDFVSPLLDSFGYGDVNDAYASNSHYFFGLEDREFVLSEFAKRLQSGTDGSKMWSLYCLAEFHKAGQPEIENELELIQGCLIGPELVRDEAAHCLGALCVERADQILESLVNDSSERVRDRAAHWLSFNRKP